MNDTGKKIPVLQAWLLLTGGVSERADAYVPEGIFSGIYSIHINQEFLATPAIIKGRIITR